MSAAYATRPVPVSHSQHGSVARPLPRTGSQLSTNPHPSTKPRRTAPAPRLHLVAAPQQSKARVPFLFVCISLWVCALIGALVLNTSMASGAYEILELRRDLSVLTQTNLDLSTELETLATPGHLVQAAELIGMAPAQGIGHLRLQDSSIIGSAQAAQTP